MRRAIDAMAISMVVACLLAGCGAPDSSTKEVNVNFNEIFENIKTEADEAEEENGNEPEAESESEQNSGQESGYESESEPETGQEPLAETQQNEEPEQKTEPVILEFVDVFGEKYETEIKDDVPKHDYDNSFFQHDGYRLSYEDDVYTSRLGVDVSRHQGKINWEKVRDEGIEFAFIRIGYRGYGKEGKVLLDQRFHENIKGAQSVGIDVGVYFFAQAINEEEALEEAKFVTDSLSGYELQLPVVYDPESILDDVARTDDVSGEQFTKNTRVFCDAISASGFEPMVYSNMLWEAFELDLSQLTDIPIWYADYELLPQTPYHFVFWQYTNEGRVKGIDGNMDLNIQMIKK